MRTVLNVCLVLIGGLTVYLLTSLGVLDTTDGAVSTGSTPTFSLPNYLDFWAVMMTTITAVLAAVAIGIGIVAAYTIPEIKKQAEKIANDVSSEKVETVLSDKEIQQRVEVALAKQRNPKLKELEPGYDPTNDGER